MLNIRPISDLRNNYTEIEKIVENDEPVFLTKNGYGKMVVMSVDSYSSLINDIEASLDRADYEAEHTKERLTAEQVFSGLRKRVNEAKIQA